MVAGLEKLRCLLFFVLKTEPCMYGTRLTDLKPCWVLVAFVLRAVAYRLGFRASGSAEGFGV